MQAQCKTFVRAWLLATVAGLAGVAGFNVLVDPAGAYQGLHLRAFEPLRFLDMDRVAKAELARHGGWEVIILGSSRSKAGLPATHPFLVNNRTCNLSVDGATFPELATAFDYALKHNPLKHVVLCLDLNMFSNGPGWVLDFPESRFNPGFDRFAYYCKQLLGRDSTERAWATVRRYRQGDIPPVQARNGFYDHRLNAETSQRELFDRVLRLMAASYRRQTLDPANLELFRHMVRECRDEKIDLQVAIMPVHALDIELLHACGRWPEFEKWKADLVNVLAEEGVEGRFNLWDFTGYAGPPAEAIPAPGDAARRMRFYFENSHCTPVLGGLMLDAMFGGGGVPACGVKLDRSNLKAHLARILEDRSAYARTNAVEVQWVRQIMTEVGAQPK
jgi:hypothetical protein